MKEIAYPVTFKVDEEDPKYVNASIPDIWGAVTFGEGFDDAVRMAKDLLKLMLETAPAQCEEPHTLEHTQKAFPDRKVMMISVRYNDMERLKYLAMLEKEKKQKLNEEINEKKSYLLNDFSKINKNIIFEAYNFVKTNDALTLTFLGKLLKASLKKKDKELVDYFVNEIVEECGDESQSENYSKFPIDDLIKNKYYEHALKLLRLSEHEDCTFLTGYNVYIKEAYCYLKLKDFASAHGRLIIPLEEGDVEEANELERLITQEERKEMRKDAKRG